MVLDCTSHKQLRSGYAGLKLVAAFVAGAATVVTFSPFGLFLVGIVWPAVLFYLWLQAGPRQAFWLGLCYGIGLFGVGVSWVYVSMHVYGHMPVLLAGFAVLIFVLILSLYVAIAGWLQAWFTGSFIIRAGLGIPALWTLTEWLRGWLWTGFPWLSLGYGQTESAFSGVAQWLGIYGVSWITAATAGLLAGAALATAARRRLLFFGCAAMLWLAGWGAGQWSWVQADGSPVRVAVVQGNVALIDKWEPAQRASILTRYLALSAAELDRDLIIWPEAALPFYLDTLPDEFWTALNEHPADFVFGVLERRTQDGSEKSYNSVVAESSERSLYRKQHLVPFGEFLPLPLMLSWIVDYLKIPMSDFSAWQSVQQPVSVAGTRAGLSICYEDAFAEEIRRTLPAAAVLINVSEDSWFGNSLAPHQRVDMARMRALENSRPVIRAGNTGVSAIIDHNGRTIAQTEQFVPAVLRAEVQPMQGTTPFSHLGSWPIVLFCVLMTLVNVWSSFTAERKPTVS